MRERIPSACSVLMAVLAAVGAPALRGAEPAATPAALRAEVQALEAPGVPWREIAWKSCLLEGLEESREKKPVLLWIFIDRPADDARC